MKRAHTYLNSTNGPLRSAPDLPRLKEKKTYSMAASYHLTSTYSCQIYKGLL